MPNLFSHFRAKTSPPLPLSSKNFSVGYTMASPEKTQVVIVGGSSGAGVAALLSKARAKFDPARNELTLISQLPYHVHRIASARFITTSEGNLDSTSQAFFSFDKLFPPGSAGKFVQGKVIYVMEDHVELEDGRSIPFDFLVLALGSQWPAPMNFDYTTDENVKEHIETWRDRIDKANSVTIIGGGAVGIGSSHLPSFSSHQICSEEHLFRTQC